MLDTNKFKENISEVKKKEQQKEQKLIGSLRPHKNHILFSFNKKTFEIKKAVFEKVDFKIGEAKPNRKVIIEKDCEYIPKLNMKSLLKKLKKDYPENYKEILKANNGK